MNFFTREAKASQVAEQFELAGRTIDGRRIMEQQMPIRLTLQLTLQARCGRTTLLPVANGS